MNALEKALINVSRPGLLCRLEPAAGWLARAAFRPVLSVRRWNRTRRDARALRNMSDHLLKDIGLTRDDVL